MCFPSVYIYSIINMLDVLSYLENSALGGDYTDDLRTYLDRYSVAG